MNNFEQTIKELAEYTGLELKVNTNNAVFLEYNDLPVTLQYRENNDDICIFSSVTDPENIDNLDEETLRNALNLAFNGEGTENNFLGLDNGELILSNAIPLQNLTVEEFALKIINFSHAAVRVYNALLAWEPEAYMPRERDFQLLANQLICC